MSITRLQEYFLQFFFSRGKDSVEEARKTNVCVYLVLQLKLFVCSPMWGTFFHLSQLEIKLSAATGADDEEGERTQADS